MKSNQVNGLEIKVILASKIYQDGCGQASIRDIYDQNKSRNYIDHDSVIVHEFQELLKVLGINIVAEWEQSYPKQLSHLRDPPLLLFTRGNIDLLEIPSITVVGTRKSTRYGEYVVDRLIESNIDDTCLISGLAYGIDSYVHENCLEYEIPTIAVVAGGIDVGYPSQKEGLYQRISKNGLILAEFPPGINLGKGMFPMRNRLLAALSSKCVVIEAPEGSGSLITASFANELGREVYSVPGAITNINSSGTNWLIKSGAEPITQEEDFKLLYSDITDTHNKLLS